MNAEGNLTQLGGGTSAKVLDGKDSFKSSLIILVIVHRVVQSSGLWIAYVFEIPLICSPNTLS